MNGEPVRALIAEDETLLAQALAAELRAVWPQLELLAPATDGLMAVERALQALPELLFLDIRMPGCSGLEAAQAVVEEWPADRALPLIVFVTAYDRHAVEAFELSAADYLLKPVQPARLQRCCDRLKGLLNERSAARAVEEPAAEARLLAAMQQLLRQPSSALVPPTPLTTLTAALGSTLHFVPVAEVLYLETADKYVRVLTAEREYLLRTPLKDLLAQLPPGVFEQVHRSVAVRSEAIQCAVRDESGKLFLNLRGRPEKLPVSRLYAPRFKAM